MVTPMGSAARLYMDPDKCLAERRVAYLAAAAVARALRGLTPGVEFIPMRQAGTVSVAWVDAVALLFDDRARMVRAVWHAAVLQEDGIAQEAAEAALRAELARSAGRRRQRGN